MDKNKQRIVLKMETYNEKGEDIECISIKLFTEYCKIIGQ